MFCNLQMYPQLHRTFNCLDLTNQGCKFLTNVHITLRSRATLKLFFDFSVLYQLDQYDNTLSQEPVVEIVMAKLPLPCTCFLPFFPIFLLRSVNLSSPSIFFLTALSLTFKQLQTTISTLFWICHRQPFYLYFSKKNI